MNEDTIVHFVCFNTALEFLPFMKRWESYTRSLNSDVSVTMHQCKSSNSFNYIAQHRCCTNEFKFTFSKMSKRSPHVAQISIINEEAGGYSILQLERKGDAHADENKVFVFIYSPDVDLDVYRRLSTHCALNIYSAFYENCRYSFIMEYFIKAKYTTELIEQLNTFENIHTGIYKERSLQAV